MSHYNYMLLITLSCIGAVRLQFIVSGSDEGWDDNRSYAMQNSLSNAPFLVYSRSPRPFKKIYNQINKITQNRSQVNQDRESLQKLENAKGLIGQDNCKLFQKNLQEKRSFSPWGGKREHVEQVKTYNYKRIPYMPKRVRFSPWGGKRSKFSKQTIDFYPETTVDHKNLLPYDMDDDLINNPDPHFEESFSNDVEKEVLPVSNERIRDEISNSYKKSLSLKPYNKEGKRRILYNPAGTKQALMFVGPKWARAAKSLKSLIDDFFNAHRY